MAESRQHTVLPGFGLTLGYTTFALSAIVLLPLAAMVVKASGIGWEAFIKVLIDPRAVASYKLTFGTSVLAALVNLVFGFAIAWTLTRYDFPGRKIIDALVEMPFALPTAVYSIAIEPVIAENAWLC